VVARADIVGAEGRPLEAKSAYQQTVDELETKQEISWRNPGAVAVRDIEKLQITVQGRQGVIDAATAATSQAEARLTSLLPARTQRRGRTGAGRGGSGKGVVRPGVDGRVEQFTLQVGGNVNPLGRPAGVPVPEGAGQGRQHAGFHQVELQVVKVGMAAVMTCASKLWIVIPMVVTGVQDLIAAGQIRAGEQLIDAQQVTRPGNNPGVHGADLRGRLRRRHPLAALASPMPTAATTT
jgi:multidrug resistance efflux pump